MRLFGTDGVRGRYPDELTPDLFQRLGKILGQIVANSNSNMLALGYDSRQVSKAALSDLFIGVNSGASDTKNQLNIQYLDISPTPLISYVAKQESCWGVSVTASHNLHPYTGAKIFMPGGKKLDSSLSNQIDSALQNDELATDFLSDTSDEDSKSSASSEDLPTPNNSYAKNYLAMLAESIEGRNLEGTSVVVDAANGATSPLLPEALENLGAEVSLICAEPNGTNINQDCGSTNPQKMLSALEEQPQFDNGFHIGLMLDGDGDRLLACLPPDNSNRLTPCPIAGDEILAIFALDMLKRNQLENSSVVTTVMSNQGFHNSMKAHSISVETTQVGDQNVSDAMMKSGAVLGGEDSGHTIFSRFSMHGDGLLTAVQLLDVLKRSEKSLAELLAESMQRIPHTLLNIEVTQSAEMIISQLKNDIEKAQQQLGTQGRILIRPSGTEPVIRVLVEADSAEQAQELATQLAKRVEELNT